MKPANFVLLHTTDMNASSAFYRSILNAQPVEASPTFAMFVTSAGFKLGLWRKDGVVPATSGFTGSSEIVFSCENREEVDQVYADWSQLGINILQKPEDMDFGRTFTAADPDGHRLRVYCVAE